MTTPAQSARKFADDLDATLTSIVKDINDLRADVDALRSGTTAPDPVTPDPAPIDPPAQTALSINVSHEHYTNCVEPDGSRPTGYSVTDPRFVALYGQYDTIRVMNWTAQTTARQRNRTWLTRTTFTDFLPSDRKRWGNTGVPIEGLIEVANACNSNIWWNFPQQCDADFMAKAGDTFSRLLKPALHVYLEGPNEFWNGDRGWYYKQRSGDDFGVQAQLYAEDCDHKFRAFGHNFDPHRTTRILGAQLADIGVLTSNVLKHIGPSGYDAISPSGYFGSDISRNAHWRTGNHGLEDAMNDLRVHADIARDAGKKLCIYELNQHMTNDPLASADEVTNGVQAMIDYAKSLGADPICLYSGVGNYYDSSPWPLYDTSYQPRRPATLLGLPTI